MTSYTRWKDVRASHVERAGGEEAVQVGKEELLAPVRGRRLAEIRRSRGFTAILLQSHNFCEPQSSQFPG